MCMAIPRQCILQPKEPAPDSTRGQRPLVKLDSKLELPPPVTHSPKIKDLQRWRQVVPVLLGFLIIVRIFLLIKLMWFQGKTPILEFRLAETFTRLPRIVWCLMRQHELNWEPPLLRNYEHFLAKNVALQALLKSVNDLFFFLRRVYWSRFCSVVTSEQFLIELTSSRVCPQMRRTKRPFAEDYQYVKKSSSFT